VSGRIVREVLEHAPADLTAAEMLVYITLAEEARDRGRSACVPADRIAFRARLSVGTVYKALGELGRRGLILGQNRARLGTTQRYTLVALVEGHRKVTRRTKHDPAVRQHMTPESGSLGGGPVDNRLVLVSSLTPERTSMTRESEEHDPRVRPLRNPTVRAPSSGWSRETQQVSGAP
jgi:hypothetical protein